MHKKTALVAFEGHGCRTNIRREHGEHKEWASGGEGKGAGRSSGGGGAAVNGRGAGRPKRGGRSARGEKKKLSSLKATRRERCARAEEKGERKPLPLFEGEITTRDRKGEPSTKRLPHRSRKEIRESRMYF